MENSALPASKCYLTPEGTGLITCPCCGFGKTVHFKEAIPVNCNVKIRCKCGETFERFLEVRQHYRRHVKLMGDYTNVTSKRSGSMIVENISRTGIGFRVMGVEHVKKEDHIKFSFVLDNKKESRIVANGSVKHIMGNFVGCRILQIREGEKELGFYLMP